MQENNRQPDEVKKKPLTEKERKELIAELRKIFGLYD